MTSIPQQHGLPADLPARSATGTAAAIRWAERGALPDWLVRLGIRRLLAERVGEAAGGDTAAFAEALARAPIAAVPEKANAQHYEVPADFFAQVLGPHRKYSSCFWPEGAATLEEAERHALSTTCRHAGLADGQRILELGCGWGSLSLWMAQHFPGARITVVSNSHSQRVFIEAQAQDRGLHNLQVLTRDMNELKLDAGTFDRVVSVEMFEHLRNWPLAFSRVARWLAPGGRFFMHVFTHRGAPYLFEDRGAGDWMSRYFFSGGMMPSTDLALWFQDHLRIERQWHWDGTHYRRTARAWLDNMDARRAATEPVLAATYGAGAPVWWHRWRLFFMAVEELFGHDQGRRWGVDHYLFERRA
jgi:cyclopropane-fatty-acyl-phospholipid synthase